MIAAAMVAAVLLGSFYVLWVLYLAVMNLKRAQEAGTLSRTAYVMGMPVLWLGYLFDAFVNTTLLTLLLWELPRWPTETICTQRLIRHHKTSTGWRLRVVLWFEPLLDPYDPSGDHI